VINRGRNEVNSEIGPICASSVKRGRAEFGYWRRYEYCLDLLQPGPAVGGVRLQVTRTVGLSAAGVIATV
jgi:hypothetical protein